MPRDSTLYKKNSLLTHNIIMEIAQCSYIFVTIFPKVVSGLRTLP